MGGPGSGRRPPDVSTPIDPKSYRWLYHGIRARMLAGDEDAQAEYLMRLDKLRLDAVITSQQHQDLVKSAMVRRSISLHVNAERRTKRVEEAVRRLEEARAPKTNLRDVGPPDDMFAAAGEPPSDEKH